MEAMPLLFAHKYSTVFLLVDPAASPPRDRRGWPFFEEALTTLFKEAPPPKRYRLPDIGPTHLWPNVVRVGDDDARNLGRSQGPPLAPSRFLEVMGDKALSQESDRARLVADYQHAVGHGFSGLERVLLSRRGWTDEDLMEFARTLQEVECPHVWELDLSANDITVRGLESLGEAIANGALHSLQSLNLADCAGLLALPDALAELHMLHTLKLDGCIGLTAFPQAFAQMVALKSVHVTHCQKLLNNAEALSVLPPSVHVVKEKKKKKEA